jgi:hypothetical protein
LTLGFLKCDCGETQKFGNFQALKLEAPAAGDVQARFFSSTTVIKYNHTVHHALCISSKQFSFAGVCRRPTTCSGDGHSLLKDANRPACSPHDRSQPIEEPAKKEPAREISQFK